MSNSNPTNQALAAAVERVRRVIAALGNGDFEVEAAELRRDGWMPAFVAYVRLFDPPLTTALVACVEALVKLRTCADGLQCDRQDGDAPYLDCDCEACDSIRAARAALTAFVEAAGGEK